MIGHEAHSQESQEDKERLRRRLASKQVEIAFGHIPLNLGFVFLASVVSAFLLHGQVTAAALACWLGAMLFTLLLRLALYAAYMRRRPISSPGTWIGLFASCSGLAGIVWGMALPIFGPALPVPYQCFLLLLLGGAIGSGSVFQASIYSSCIAFVLTATVPSILLLALFGFEPVHFAALILVVLFSLVTVMLARRMHRAIITSTTFEFRNENILRHLRKSEERFRTLTENSAAGYFIMQNGRITYLNPTGERIIGYQLEDLRKMSFLDLIHPEHRELVRRRAALRMRGDALEDLPARYEFKLLHRDGSAIWADYTPGVLQIDGETAIIGTVFDITDKKKAEQKLLVNEKRFRMLFNRANDPMFLIGMGEDLRIGALKDVNEAACEATGRSREELLALKAVELFDEDSPNLFRAILAKLSLDGKIVFETELKARDGSTTPVEISAQMSQFDGTTLIHAIARDITLKKQLMEKLTELANTDPLTGCLNRRSFWNRGASELDRSRRYSRPLALLMIDIDHFKTINDTYGHSMGDVVLRSLVAKCQVELRATDLFGRIGGEEFTALLLETDITEARAVAERIRTVLEQTQTSYGSARVSCTVSVGLTVATADDRKLDELINRADTALYHAKDTGRNRVVAFEDIP